MSFFSLKYENGIIDQQRFEEKRTKKDFEMNILKK